MRRRGVVRVLLILGISAVVWWADRANSNHEETGEGGAELVAAFQAQRSGLDVEIQGAVVRLLPDDTVGSRHQRFILELPGGHTVLVSHNLELAPRVPLREGVGVVLRGQYEWNDRGGVVHWTHHDPQGRRQGGWIRAGGQTYR